MGFPQKNYPDHLDTEIGGVARAFPSTHWSRILRGPDGGPRAAGSISLRRRESLEALAAAYWKPVYAYMRTRWARSNEDAKDCTQAFFLWMLESGFLETASPERGRFRGYIKQALENFLTDLERKRTTLKRGGGHRFVPVDDEERPALELIDSSERSPGDVLDELWRSELLERGLGTLERELMEVGKQTVFEVFRDYFLTDSDID